MSAFATLAAAERRLYLEQVATRLGVVPVIVEKDFWVCWILGRIFATPAVAAHLVFKGGTSLFKVFQVIARFSEDVDLSMAPASLGFAEEDLDEAPVPRAPRPPGQRPTRADESRGRGALRGSPPATRCHRRSPWPWPSAPRAGAATRGHRPLFWFY